MYVPNQKSLIDEIDELGHINIYSYYIGKKIISLPISFKSPLRKDEHPSFGLFMKNNKVLWKDFTLNKGGDVYKFVQELYGLNFYQAIRKIRKDLILNTPDKSFTNIKLVETNRKVYLQPYYFKNPPQSYYDYWDKYKVITKDILYKNNVQAIKYAFMNYSLKLEYSDSNPIIGYSWKRRGKIYHKIYQPCNEKQKFISDFRGTSRYLVHNLNRIDKCTDNIIITKSVKDSMVFEGLNYNAISIQNEGISIPKEIMEYLNTYYKKIYLFYDNDFNKNENWGQKAAKKLVKTYPYLINCKIDGRHRVTDISDFIKKYDKQKTIKLLKNLII